jgi:GrpB-like predicted nucleotidyltransferase (UPF0157 family)
MSNDGKWELPPPPKPASEERLTSITVGERTPLNGSIHLAPYDPDWPSMFARVAARVRAALSDKALLLEHVGSTSIAGLCAKPVIDMVLAVEDTANEASYVPPLEARGFVLRIREPDWFEHRLLKSHDVESNVHVFSAGCSEIERMLAFRNWLRVHDDDRRLYEKTKMDLAARTWRHVQNYADAKSDIVREILERANPIHSDARRSAPSTVRRPGSRCS